MMSIGDHLSRSNASVRIFRLGNSYCSGKMYKSFGVAEYDHIIALVFTAEPNIDSKHLIVAYVSFLKAVNVVKLDTVT